MKITILTTFILTSLIGAPVWAQDSDVEELNLIEMELDKSASPRVSDDDISDIPATKQNTKESGVQAGPEKTLQEDLSHLSEFKQVSVIQKRYLPRTGRFQAYVGPSMTLNDPWYNVMGASIKLGYNLTEAWGLEGNYSFLSTDKTMAHKELKSENNITTDGFVYTKSYYTLGVNWTPLYGKMTWLNEKIVYYDIYFSAGFGGTEIQTGDKQDTFSIGAGQIFSITKAYAFRWDLSWNIFEAQQIDASQGTYNNVILSAGISIFFPEAGYR